MKKKIIMCVYNDLKTDARVLRSAEALAKDYEVHLLGLCSDNFTSNSYKVHNVSLSRKNNISKYIEFVIKVLKYLKTNDCDIFYAHDYYTAIVVSRLLKLKRNIKIIYDAHELIIPNNRLKHGLREKIFYKIEKSIIKEVELLIVANEARALLMKKHYNLDRAPVVVENISQLTSEISDESKMKYKKFDYFFEKDCTYIVYAGVLVKHREIDKLFNLVLKSKIPTKLLIIGGGPDYNRLVNMAKETIPDKYMFTGKLPYDEMGYMINKCDIGYLNYPNDTWNNRYNASNKVYEYASLKIPMFSNENLGLLKTFETYKIGVANDNFNKAFDFVCNNMSEMKQNCLYFTEENNWATTANRLKENVKKL